jgi:hypothetical protein
MGFILRCAVVVVLAGFIWFKVVQGFNTGIVTTSGCYLS